MDGWSARGRKDARVSLACVLCALVTPSAAAQVSAATQPLVLVLEGVRGSRSAPPVTVLWILVASAPSPPAPSAVARQSQGHPVVGAPDQPSTWVAFDSAAPPTVMVALLGDGGLPQAGLDAATSLVERTLRISRESGLTRPATLGKLAEELSAHVSGQLSGAAGTVPRLLDVQELRLSVGEMASARVGVAVNKQLDFIVGHSSYRARFQVAGIERFRRSAATP